MEVYIRVNMEGEKLEKTFARMRIAIGEIRKCCDELSDMGVLHIEEKDSPCEETQGEHVIEK